MSLSLSGFCSKSLNLLMIMVISYDFNQNLEGKIFNEPIDQLLTNETFFDDIPMETPISTTRTTFDTIDHSIINTISMTTSNSEQASYHKQFFFIRTMIHLFL